MMLVFLGLRELSGERAAANGSLAGYGATSLSLAPSLGAIGHDALTSALRDKRH